MSRAYWITIAVLGFLTFQAIRTAVSLGTDEAGIFGFVVLMIFLAAVIVPLVVRHRRKIAAGADSALIGSLAAGVRAKRKIGRAGQRLAERVKEKSGD